MFIFLLTVYITSVIIIYGMMFAWGQRAFAIIAENCVYQDCFMSLIFSIVCGLFGPIGVLLVYIFLDFGKYKLKFIPKYDFPYKLKIPARLDNNNVNINEIIMALNESNIKYYCPRERYYDDDIYKDYCGFIIHFQYERDVIFTKMFL